MAFTRKQIEFDIQLEDGGSMSIRDFACDVSVEKVGLPDKNKAKCTIYGLSMQTIEQLTSLCFLPLTYKKNRIVIRAGDEGNLSQLYIGDITVSHGVGQGAPDFALEIEAQTGFVAAMTAQDPETVDGKTQTGGIVDKIMTPFGFTRESQGGEDVQIQNAVLQGDPLHKAWQAASQSGRELVVDDDKMLLLPETGVRQGAAVELSVETGLVGYPNFTSEGITCRSFFNPNIQYGGELHLTSALPKASGTWRITKVTHNLSAYKAGGGPWFTEIEAMARVDF